MEQSVNTFQDGLQLDSHPMVQSNTSLSNALNATFITMNGNEVILQNDMGNRRIDEAYLPAGYVPVGIKEYGGIIYIAAHNPLTHTDQIGSFPSPERNIGEEYPGLSVEIKSDFKDYFTSTDDHEVPDMSSDNKQIKKTIYLTNVESELLILTENNILHAGDKFTTYFKDNDVPTSFDGSKISNYNITGTSFNNLLNKQYTLYLGVLNAQNQFVDITKSLERWNDNGIIIDTSNLSEEEKFNTGYFIPKLSTVQAEELITVDDKKYLENRLTKGVNTYAYKLVGPLSLKIGLNTPQNFDYEIRGEMRNIEGAQHHYARITAIITYNCPDPIFNFYTEGRFYQGNSPYYNVINDSIDEINNLKTRTIVRECTINPDGDSDLTKYPYYIGVQTFNDDDTYYLEKFWDEGYLDLTLFGTGKIKLTGWRFYNDWDESSNDAECYLSCNVMAYPLLDEEISNLEIAFSTDKKTFDNEYSGNDLTWTTLSPLVGKVGMFKSSWKELGNLEPQKLYWVHFRWQSSDSNNAIDGYKYKENAAFFLTTNLFNPCYTLGSEDFIDNFNKFSTHFYNSSSDLSSEEKTIVEEYQTINIYPNFTTNLSRGVPDIDVTGLTLLKKKEEEENETDFPASVKVKYNINCSIADNGLIYDKIKYPSNIITDDSLIRASNGATYEISHKGYTIGLENNKNISINTIVEGGKNFTNEQTFSEINSDSSNNSQCTFSVELPEYFNSGITSTDITINNAFITLKEAIQDQMNDEDYKYINFVLGYCERGSGLSSEDDHKVIRLLCLKKSFKNKSDQNISVGKSSTFDITNSCDKDYTDDIYKNNRRWESGTDKERLELNFVSEYFILVDSDSNDNDDYIFNYNQNDLSYLNLHNIPDKQNFSYLFIDNPAESEHSDYYENYQRFYNKIREKKPKGINNRNYTLLFWRGNDDSWYIYPKLIQKKTETSETGQSLLDVLGNLQNLYYSYEVIKEDVSNLSAHDTNSYIYTLPYSVDFEVKFSVSYNSQTQFDINEYDDFEIFKTEFNKTNEIKSTTTLEAKSLQNYIPKLLSNTFSNVVTSTLEEDSELIGTFTDGNGNELQPYTIYYKKSEELMPLSNNLNKTFAVSSPVGYYRHLVPKTQPYEGDFEYKYLITGQEGGADSVKSDHTVIFELSKVLLTNEFQSFRSLTTETEQQSSTSSSNSSSSGYSSSSSDSSKLQDYYQSETINKDSITDADLLQRYKTMQP